MSLNDRVQKVTAELAEVAERYATRTPDSKQLIKQVMATGMQAFMPGGAGATPEMVKHLAAMAIGVLALIEPEIQSKEIEVKL